MLQARPSENILSRIEHWLCRLWLSQGARYVSFLGQSRPLTYDLRTTQGTTNDVAASSAVVLPYDITEGPRPPRKSESGHALKYLSVHCTPVTAVSSRHLRSANQHQLTTPRCRRITFGRRAFSVAGPTVWNSLPTEFWDLSLSFGDFRRSLKTILFARY